MASSSSSKKIVLISSDKERFEVEESVAYQCNTIKHLIEDLDDTRIPLPNVTGKVLSKVIEYCKKHVDATKEDAHKQWDNKFIEKMDQPTLFELVLAANYMDVRNLLDLGCQQIADMIKGKSPEEVRKIFNIENDFTPEEEAAVRAEHPWAFE